MEFQHDTSWDYLTELLRSKLKAQDAWMKFIDRHEKDLKRNYWADLRNLNINEEQAEIVEWIEKVVVDEPIPKTIVAIWVGIFKLASDDKEIPTIYFVGADTYDKEDIDWASDPTYLPDNRYVQPGILQQIDNAIRPDKENYEFLDWILPVAYCAFTFEEIIRTKLNKKLFLKNKSKVFAAVGHDSGDYVDLSPIQ